MADLRIDIDIDDLPELDLPVAIAGSMRESEVGGSVCMDIVIGLGVYISNG